MSPARADADEPKRIHPRDDVMRLEGVEGPAATFEAALASGRLHHAWLLTGPEGVGKARFAVRVARRLLGAPPDPSAGPLGSVADSPAERLISARAHPDFLMLERDAPDGGKPRRTIPVDEVRRLPGFFSQTPAIAPYRVAVIDSADDLNANAANAVLKTLEEPPPRGVLLLVSHAPGRLLDTLRSRCRTLRFAPFGEVALADQMMRAHGLDAASAKRVAALARGSLGRAHALAQSAGPDLRGEAQALLDDLARPDEARLQKLAESFRGGEGAERFAALLAALSDAVQTRAQDAVAAGRGGADAWAAAWRRTSQAAAEAEAVNLDRSDAFWAVMDVLRAAGRRPD